MNTKTREWWQQVKERFLKLNKERGEIVNAYDEVLYVRRERDGKEVYVAPSTET